LLDNYCDNHIGLDFEYCYPKGRPPIGVDLTSGSSASSSDIISVDPATVPYEKELGPNITNLDLNGYDKNTFSKIFFDNDKEKLPEKINSTLNCKGAGALKGFDLSKREDIKFKWDYYFSFNYGCTKGDKNDFVSSAAQEFVGNSTTEDSIMVPKKDKSGNINQAIGNSCSCPTDSIMKNIEFPTNPDLKNPYGINCSCVKTNKPVTCLKKIEETRDLGSKCPILGFGLYPKLKLSVSEGTNRVLKSFTFGFNDSTKNCNPEFCQNLAKFEYEYCFETGTQIINPKIFGPIASPNALSNTSTTSTSQTNGDNGSNYQYIPTNTYPTTTIPFNSIPTTTKPCNTYTTTTIPFNSFPTTTTPTNTYTTTTFPFNSFPTTTTPTNTYTTTNTYIPIQSSSNIDINKNIAYDILNMMKNPNNPTISNPYSISGLNIIYPSNSSPTNSNINSTNPINKIPTSNPVVIPTVIPTTNPSVIPTVIPTTNPSVIPTVIPTS